FSSNILFRSISSEQADWGSGNHNGPRLGGVRAEISKRPTPKVSYRIGRSNGAAVTAGALNQAHPILVNRAINAEKFDRQGILAMEPLVVIQAGVHVEFGFKIKSVYQVVVEQEELFGFFTIDVLNAAVKIFNARRIPDNEVCKFPGLPEIVLIGDVQGVEVDFGRHG